MELIFQTSIVDKGETLIYDVFEYRLNRGIFRAILRSGNTSKEIIFWKDKDGWKARFHKDYDIAGIIGRRIEERRKC
jgi:hypothetical protein